MKYLILFGFCFIFDFRFFITASHPISKLENINQLDTLVRKIAIQSDTDSYLVYLYKNPFSCQMPSFTPSCIFYNDTFIDTCFDLSIDDLNYLKKKGPEKELNLYSKFFKNHMPKFKSSKAKRNFIGFKFSIYTCRIIVKRENIKKMQCNLPENTKYLVSVREAFFLDSVRILRD